MRTRGVRREAQRELDPRSGPGGSGSGAALGVRSSALSAEREGELRKAGRNGTVVSLDRDETFARARDRSGRHGRDLARARDRDLPEEGEPPGALREDPGGQIRETRAVSIDGSIFAVPESPCPVCGSADPRTRLAVASMNPRIGGDFVQATCSRCPTTYLATRLAPRALATAYEALPSAAAAAPPLPAPGSNPLVRMWRGMDSMAHGAMLVREGPVLDAGCGSGAFLAIMKARGIEAEGVDFSPSGVERCRALGLRAERADLASFEPPARGYKAIVLFQVLEHMPDPVDTLRRLARGLAEDGTLIVTVPNVDSMMRSAFGRHWNGWDAPYHLTHFSATSLAHVGRQADLSVDGVRSIANADELRRCLMFRTKRCGRMLGLRIAATPAFLLAGAAGRGGHLLARFRHAETPSPRGHGAT